MTSIIVGTAGHIDHGKTALVKALTGIDADRLAEEKRRGITIDLGFAHMSLPAADGGTLQIGFVDVPGHERFVRNMLAGVGGIDLVLLVIAADESIKPQTREHFDILQLLGVKRGITVLTKSDAVDAETLDVVRLEVEEFLRGTFLESPSAPIVAVSSRTGAGLEELKRAIVSAAGQVEPRDSQALARLPIDRVFTMKGFGTVVTGTLISGTIQREDELEVFPSGRKVRVRGIQVHGQAADRAAAGQRTALNLAGATTDELSRGMTLARAATFTATRMVDLHLRLLASAPRVLKDRARVHFHAYSMEAIGEIVFQRSTHLNPQGMKVGPGGEAFARIRLPEPVLLLPGDRFILRQFSPVVTIGGGVVLDAAPISRFKQVTVDALLQHALAGKLAEMLAVRVARRWYHGLTMAQAVSETGLRRDAIQKHMAGAFADGTMLKFGDLFFYSGTMSALTVLIPQTLALFHEKNPLVPGMAKETLREQYTLSPEVFTAVLDRLVREKKVEVAGEHVRIPGRGVVMKDEEAESKKKIEDAFASAGLKVPALHEVLAGLKIDKGRAQKIVTLLLRDRVLVKISDELVFHRSALEQLRVQIAARKAKSAMIDVAAFKEMTGVSRKYAIPLLEYLDRERVTKRVGDARQIL
ncbi:MAG TPA: selenocysteine-specific translation elongation factor [Candidatus Sulfotelmatobacter sp.]|nr:selenocysteine-specific translation elongation factor [Candidatus Sulfotelmatobacter sp.]